MNANLRACLWFPVRPPYVILVGWSNPVCHGCTCLCAKAVPDNSHSLPELDHIFFGSRDDSGSPLNLSQQTMPVQTKRSHSLAPPPRECLWSSSDLCDGQLANLGLCNVWASGCGGISIFGSSCSVPQVYIYIYTNISIYLYVLALAARL